MNAPPWWGSAVVLTAWCAGIMTAVLLRPPAVIVIGATAILVGLSVVHARHAALVLVITAGFLLGSGRGLSAPVTTLPVGLSGQEVALSGSVVDDPLTRRGGTRVVVSTDSLGRDTLRVLATLYGIRPPQFGDRLVLVGRLEAPDRFEQFDYRTYLADQGISAILQSARLVRATPQGGDLPHSLLFRVRHALVDAVDRALPEPQAALLLGVVFGYRAALPPALQQQMITSGLIHIVVISGLKASKLIQTGVRMTLRSEQSRGA